jgi:branched-chain amino acid transport system permease protein
VILTIGVAAAIPLIFPAIYTNLVIEIAVFALFAVSYNLLLGYTGLLSFGHSAYFGIGAYALGILLTKFSGASILLGILIGGCASAAAGVLAGCFCVRLKGAFFALLTLAFNQFFFAIALKWRRVTGGDDGIAFIPPDLWMPFIGSLNMVKTVNVYYLAMTIVLICLCLAWMVTASPLGVTIRAIKVNEERAEFVGNNVFLAKLTIFAISSFFAGVAGATFALHQQLVSLSMIDLHRSTEAIFMTYIGGTGSFLGPALGSVIYVVFTDWISRITDRWGFVLGILFVVIVLFFNKGVSGFFAHLKWVGGGKGMAGGRNGE